MFDNEWMNISGGAAAAAAAGAGSRREVVFSGISVVGIPAVRGQVARPGLSRRPSELPPQTLTHTTVEAAATQRASSAASTFPRWRWSCQ